MPRRVVLTVQQVKKVDDRLEVRCRLYNRTSKTLKYRAMNSRTSPWYQIRANEPGWTHDRGYPSFCMTGTIVAGLEPGRRLEFTVWIPYADFLQYTQVEIGIRVWSDPRHLEEVEIWTPAYRWKSLWK